MFIVVRVGDNVPESPEPEPAPPGLPGSVISSALVTQTWNITISQTLQILGKLSVRDTSDSSFKHFVIIANNF